MYRRFLSTLIFAILILTISGYGGAKSVDNSSAAQPAAQKLTELKVVKIQYSQNNNYEKANLNNLLANSPADQGQAVEIVLVPGERMFYEFPLHGSVGVSCRYIIEDNTIVKLTENKEVYIHPERSDIPGGDAAIGTFYFEAVQPGHTVVTLQHIFRGSIETEKRINVIVAD